MRKNLYDSRNGKPERLDLPDSEFFFRTRDAAEKFAENDSNASGLQVCTVHQVEGFDGPLEG